jgi:5-methylcytosine-specific restriction protein A
MVAGDGVTRNHVWRAIGECDQLGPDAFLSEHGFGHSRNGDVVWKQRRNPHEAISGTGRGFARGERLGSAISKGGKWRRPG